MNWGEKEWKWFRGSGVINSEGLINDGFDKRVLYLVGQ